MTLFGGERSDYNLGTLGCLDSGHGFQSAGMNSLDHVAFGAVSEWMFRHVLGINPDIEHPGYEHFFITPRPGGSLTWAKGAYESIHGKIVADWKWEDGVFTLHVEIPANTTATVTLPVTDVNDLVSSDGQHFKVMPNANISAEVGSGFYEFVVNNVR